MKGIELPINVLIIVVIALIILLALIGLFYGVWTPGSSGLNLEGAKNSACQMLVSTGCGDSRSILVNDFDADKDGQFEGLSNNGDRSKCGSITPDPGMGDSLFMLCVCWYNIGDIGDLLDDIDRECRTRICHCQD